MLGLQKICLVYVATTKKLLGTKTRLGNQFMMTNYELPLKDCDITEIEVRLANELNVDNVELLNYWKLGE